MLSEILLIIFNISEINGITSFLLLKYFSAKPFLRSYSLLIALVYSS